jgi:hypothetical protein
MKKVILASIILLVFVFSFDKSFGKHCHATFDLGGTIHPIYFTAPSIYLDTLFNVGDVINLPISVSSADDIGSCSCTSDSVWWIHDGVLISNSLSYTVTDTGVYSIYDNVDVAQTCLGIYNFQLTLHVGYRVTTSVNEVSSADILQIYPNPANNTVTIKYVSSNETSLLQLANALGEVVYTEKLFGKTEEVIHPDFANGIYFWKVTNDSGIQKTGKLIINKNSK